MLEKSKDGALAYNEFLHNIRVYLQWKLKYILVIMVACIMLKVNGYESCKRFGNMPTVFEIHTERILLATHPPTSLFCTHSPTPLPTTRFVARNALWNRHQWIICQYDDTLSHRQELKYTWKYTTMASHGHNAVINSCTQQSYNPPNGMKLDEKYPLTITCHISPSYLDHCVYHRILRSNNNHYILLRSSAWIEPTYLCHLYSSVEQEC